MIMYTTGKVNQMDGKAIKSVIGMWAFPFDEITQTRYTGFGG